MQTYSIKFNYAAPLLMKSTRGVNPLDPTVKQLKALTSKNSKKRTDDDIVEMLRLDYMLGAYYKPEVGMYIPAEMVEASIRAGCRVNKNGEKAKIAIFVNEECIPLQYNGPKTPDELFLLDEFKDVRVVTVNNNKVVRCRPRFNRWSLEFTLDLDETILNRDEFLMALDLAGKQKGIGDYRPRYGRFEAKVTQVA